MISSLKTREGLIYAFIEWSILDEQGKFKSRGEFIYIHDVWIYKKYRNRETLWTLIGLVDKHPFCEFAVWVYWKNGKHNFRKTKRIPRVWFTYRRINNVQEKIFA